MRYFDLGIIALYLVGITWFGAQFRSSQKSLKDYFLGGKNTPWWAISLSIVSAETSTLTIIGTPALAFGGNLSFLQLVMGYLLARLIIIGLFLPQYYRGELYTAYELMRNRFGERVRKVTASIFLVTRALAEGVRVYAISIVVAIILGVILWLAALVAALSIDQSAVGRNAMAPVGSRMVAITQSLPVLGFAMLNAAAVVAALILFHPSTAQMIPLILLVLLASATFCLLALALRLRLGRVGLTLFVLFLILQVAASGNVVPLETAPTVLQTLNSVMPLTAFINGASQLVSGGHVASYTAVVAVLLVWALVAGALMLSAVKKRRLEDPVRPGRVALNPG